MKAVSLLLFVFLVGCKAPHEPAVGPRRIAVLAGASNVQDGDKFFLEDLVQFQKGLVARGWDVRGAIGAKRNLFSGSVPATNAGIFEQTRRACADAKKDDELLLVYHSHGREAEPDWGQKTHSIVSEDRDPSGADPGFDLDVIEPLIRDASARGARVAVVDLSCYSGATQRIEGSSCTVTLAAPHYISLCSGREEEHGFVSHFLRLPEPGRATDLEAQYLAARKQERGSVNLPQISSRSTPFLAEWDAVLQSLDPLDTLEDIRSFRPGADYSAAKNPLQKFPRAIAGEIQRLIRIREQIEKAIATIQQDLRPEPVVASSGPNLRLTSAELSDVIERLDSGKTRLDDLDGYSHAQRNLFAKLAPFKNELKKKYASRVNGFRERRNNLEILQTSLETAIGDVFSSERDVYEAESREITSSCRDFAL